MLYGSIYVTFKKTKLQAQKFYQELPCTGDVGRGLPAKRAQSNFEGDGNILYLDCGNSYTAI